MEKKSKYELQMGIPRETTVQNAGGGGGGALLIQVLYFTD